VEDNGEVRALSGDDDATLECAGGAVGGVKGTVASLSGGDGVGSAFRLRVLRLAYVEVGGAIEVPPLRSASSHSSASLGRRVSSEAPADDSKDGGDERSRGAAPFLPFFFAPDFARPRAAAGSEGVVALDALAIHETRLRTRST
jgi:hypothetical protein